MLRCADRFGGSATIRLDTISFRYPAGEFRLRIPSLSVAPRETVAFIGPSGSGKTTLLNLIAGISLPDEGRVATAGTEVSALDDAARRAFRIRTIGLVFQEFELLEYLSVLENVLLPYRIGPGLELTAEVRARAEDLVARVGLGRLGSRTPDHLSHGERQRVAVCRALVTGPQLLLADEPTGNLDPTNKDKVLKILFRFAREQGATLVAVTHDHDLVARFDRAVDFKQFGAVGAGSPS